MKTNFDCKATMTFEPFQVKGFRCSSIFFTVAKLLSMFLSQHFWAFFNWEPAQYRGNVAFSSCKQQHVLVCVPYLRRSNDSVFIGLVRLSLWYQKQCKLPAWRASQKSRSSPNRTVCPRGSPRNKTTASLVACVPFCSVRRISAHFKRAIDTIFLAHRVPGINRHGSSRITWCAHWNYVQVCQMFKHIRILIATLL